MEDEKKNINLFRKIVHKDAFLAIDKKDEFAIVLGNNHQFRYLLYCAYRYLKNLKEADRELDLALSLSHREEPHYFFIKIGRLLQDDAPEALAVANEAVALVDRLKDDYYRDAIYFQRAFALIDNDRLDEAKAYLSGIEDLDANMYTGHGMFTARKLLAWIEEQERSA